MKSVALYVRSSQDLHDVSCDAQEAQLRIVATQNGESIYKVYTDKALSSTRDVRPAFDEMTTVATQKDNKPFTKIYCLDTSRFGRDNYESQVLLHQLRQKYGVEVCFANMPVMDGYMGEAMEKMMSIFDFLHSQQSKTKGVQSMKQNVRMGYRAGGRAPYGYRIVSFAMGEHRNGHGISKTKLEPNPETAPYANEYLERRAKGETRMALLKDFFERGIPSPSGRVSWSASSGKAIEDNLEVYRGHTIFNRLNERIKVRGKLDGYKGGVKYKPKEEWVVTENTHDPLISEAVANQLIRLKEKKIRATPVSAQRIYPLAGILKCGVCGTSYIGDRVIYRCNSTTQAGNRCGNHGISGAMVEDAVFSLIQEKLLNHINVNMVIDEVQSKLQGNQAESEDLKVRMKRVQQEIDKFIDLYRDDILDRDDLRRRTTSLKEQKQLIENRLQEIIKSESASQVSKEKILTVIESLREELHMADPATRKRVIHQLFERIEVFPKEGEVGKRKLVIKGSNLPLTRVYVASPTGFEPVLPA